MEMSQQKYIGASCYLLNKPALDIHSYGEWINRIKLSIWNKIEWEQQNAKERNEITHLKGRPRFSRFNLQEHVCTHFCCYTFLCTRQPRLFQDK
ncbi:hypothetical protein GHT06_018004 [Daphnia sinensis]|uniref:Uncharacterized protein n=1 Tax=Daphnia sinensis TaxID=1820382 RepID=A0AAD5KMK4_9CRUS|nr:hypothetical protein GHT06_018004 [Daphnia sinensis]